MAFYGYNRTLVGPVSEELSNKDGTFVADYILFVYQIIT